MMAQSFETHSRYTDEQRRDWAIYNCWEPEDEKIIAPPSDGHPEVVISTNRIEKNLMGIQLAMASETSKLAVEISDCFQKTSRAIQTCSDQQAESLQEVSQIIQANFQAGSAQMSANLDRCLLPLVQMVDYAGRFDVSFQKALYCSLKSAKWGKVFRIIDVLLKVGIVILLWLLLGGKAQAQGRGTSFLDCISFDNAAGVELFGSCSPFRIREGSNITFSPSGETLTIAGPAASGITTLNTLSGAIQTFATGTAGADFGISSAGTTHTFNIPSSSALNRGLLAAADWSLFNAKESALTFSAPLSRAVNTISIPAATGAIAGHLTAADWTTFNSKQDTLSTSAAVANQFLTAFTAPNTFSRAQPTFANLASTPTTVAGYGITDAVTTARNINTTAPLGGGGALSGDLTLTCTGCLTSVTAHNLFSATHSDTVTASPVLGDILYGNVTPAWTKLAGNTTATKNFFTQTGTGAVSAVPAWGAIAAGDLPSHTAALATALAADPAGCTAGGLNFTNDVNASGTSTCADVRTASATQTGIAELATTAEVATGTDTGRAVTPSGIAPSIQTGAYLACADAGASDTYTCLMTPTLTAYTTGMQVVFKANTANTGAATLNVDSLGAKTIAKLGGGITTVLADNDLRAGQWTLLVYDGTNFQMQGQLGNAAAGGTSKAILGVSGYQSMAQMAGGNSVNCFVMGASAAASCNNDTAWARSTLMPIAGTIKNLCVRLADVAQPGTGTLVFVLQKSTTASGTQPTFTNTGVTVIFAAGTANYSFACDTVNTYAFAANEMLSLKATNNAATASATILDFTMEVDF